MSEVVKMETIKEEPNKSAEAAASMETAMHMLFGDTLNKAVAKATDLKRIRKVIKEEIAKLPAEKMEL